MQEEKERKEQEEQRKKQDEDAKKKKALSNKTHQYGGIQQKVSRKLDCVKIIKEIQCPSSSSSSSA